MKSAAGALDEALSRAVEVKGVKVSSRIAPTRSSAASCARSSTISSRSSAKASWCWPLRSLRAKSRSSPASRPASLKRIQAGKLVGAVAKLVGGSGGGKPEIAEAGGKDQTQIDAALAATAGIVSELLG